jgi:iron(III) transport system substrate-binding protein
MQHRLRAPLTGLAAVILLTACGGPPTASPDAGNGGESREDSDVAQAAKEVYDKYNGMSGQERTDELVACAEEEGQLNVYTSNSDMDDIADAFSDEYDVEINVYRASGETVLQRVLQEDEAGYYGADVLENDGLELSAAESEGLLYPYEGELRETVREEGRLSEAWTGTRFNAFVVGWNTDKVAPDEVPTSLEELAEPQWKGRISMELDDVDWFTALHDYYVEKGMSEEDYTDLMTRLAANAQIVKGHTTQGELLTAGQFDVAISSYSHTIDGAADEGAPVAWRPAKGDPIQPIVVRPNGIGLVKTATNACAATLFVDFQLTGAQEVFKEDFRIGSVAGAEDPLAGLDVYSVPMEKMIEDSETWSKAYEDVVANGQAVD